MNEQNRREQSGNQVLTKTRAKKPDIVGAKARRMDVRRKGRRRGSRGRRSASKRGDLQEESRATRQGRESTSSELS